MLKTFDDEIAQSINKLMNAKTGTEVRTFIVEFEALMFVRTKLFTRMIMQEQRDKECEKAQTARNPNSIEEVLNSIRNNVYTGNDFDKKEDQKSIEEPRIVESDVTKNNILDKIEEAIQEEYAEVKRKGSIIAGIEDIFRQVRFCNPELAQYIKKRLLDIAKNDGDLQ